MPDKESKDILFRDLKAFILDYKRLQKQKVNLKKSKEVIKIRPGGNLIH